MICNDNGRTYNGLGPETLEDFVLQFTHCIGSIQLISPRFLCLIECTRVEIIQTVMAPKPFPFPLGIGVDVCQVNRIAAVICHEHTRNRWARKIFTRLEWPALCRRMQRAEKAIGEPGDQKLHNENEAIGEPYGNAIWMLPRLSGYSSTFEDENLYRSAIADERSTLGVLARHLAGR